MVSDTVVLPDGSPLWDFPPQTPVLVVLLRSVGCTFCREAMADVAAVRPQLDAAGARVAFVYGASPADRPDYLALARRALQYGM